MSLANIQQIPRAQQLMLEVCLVACIYSLWGYICVIKLEGECITSYSNFALLLAASLLVVIFMLPGIYAQVYGKSNSSTLMHFQNPSLGSHIEYIGGKIHQINQYSNRTAYLIVINHVNNTGCYAECLSAYNYTISVLGNTPNPRTLSLK